MALNRHLSRLARILVDSEGICFEDAQMRLQALTLEIVVGANANSPAAHAAVLTAVSVGRRTFIGGVKVSGDVSQPLQSDLPLRADNLRDAAREVGASDFQSTPSRRIVIGQTTLVDDVWSIATWWDGWKAGTTEVGSERCPLNNNPLVGIAAGALAVGKAFDAERECCHNLNSVVDLWPTPAIADSAPNFADVYLPGAIWLIGLGNLGQAYLWALAALPYLEPGAVKLVLQDRDKIDDANWATSVLVADDSYGMYKTRVGEQWVLAKGFDVSRIDRYAGADDKILPDDPQIALSGVDKIAARKNLAAMGFECIVDAGLGRSVSDFDRYRVTVFTSDQPIDKHFASVTDPTFADAVPDAQAYKKLEAEIGRCGTVEVAGASIATPYVSALAAAVAISRMVAITSNIECPSNEVNKISTQVCRRSSTVKVISRGSRHAGKPRIPSAR